MKVPRKPIKPKKPTFSKIKYKTVEVGRYTIDSFSSMEFPLQEIMDLFDDNEDLADLGISNPEYYSILIHNESELDYGYCFYEGDVPETKTIIKVSIKYIDPDDVVKYDDAMFKYKRRMIEYEELQKEYNKYLSDYSEWEKHIKETSNDKT